MGQYNCASILLSVAHTLPNFFWKTSTRINRCARKIAFTLMLQRPNTSRSANALSARE